MPLKNDTVSFYFFFSEEWMKRRHFSQNASFLNGNWRQSVSNFLQFAWFLVWSLVLDFFN
jgi:hypothetical protein